MYFNISLLQPERIDPRASSKGYDIRSDVWSLGITLETNSLSSVIPKPIFIWKIV
jgi:mitogen-activated protein kinase kinase 4